MHLQLLNDYIEKENMIVLLLILGHLSLAVKYAASFSYIVAKDEEKQITKRDSMDQNQEKKVPLYRILH